MLVWTHTRFFLFFGSFFGLCLLALLLLASIYWVSITLGNHSLRHTQFSSFSVNMSKLTIFFYIYWINDYSPFYFCPSVVFQCQSKLLCSWVGFTSAENFPFYLVAKHLPIGTICFLRFVPWQRCMQHA